MIGKFIKQQREYKGITLKKLGKSMGIDLSYVAKIENGSRNMQVGHIKKLSKALKVAEDEIYALYFADIILKKFGKNPMFAKSFLKTAHIVNRSINEIGKKEKERKGKK